MKIFSIRDSAVGAYLRPFYVPSKGAAIRGFTDEVNRKDSEMGAHPSDYELYEIGEFDEVGGALLGLAPVLIIRAKDVLIPQE